MKKYLVVFDNAWRVAAEVPAVDMQHLELPVVRYEDQGNTIRYGYESITADDARWPEAAAYQLQRKGVRSFAMSEIARSVAMLISTTAMQDSDRYTAIRELLHMDPAAVQEMYDAAHAYAHSMQEQKK